MLVNGYSERSYHSDSEYTQDEGVAGLALVSSNSYGIFDSPNEGIGRCFMAKGPKEIDAFEEAPKALVKWVPKTTSSSTSSSTTTTPRIHIKMMSMKAFRLPCPLSYQQESLWLLELVQDVEVDCTCSCQGDRSEVCWRSHPQELSSSSSLGPTSTWWGSLEL